jgi:hypothetical protein
VADGGRQKKKEIEATALQLPITPPPEILRSYFHPLTAGPCGCTFKRRCFSTEWITGQRQSKKIPPPSVAIDVVYHSITKQL